MSEKPKLAMYWAASCGGCEISLVNMNEKILDVDANFDFIFCPCLLDTKKKDIEAMPDKSIAITLFNGAIRTEENLEMAEILRRKSQTLIAFGSCARGGCIPALSNLHKKSEHFRNIYLENPTIDNPQGIIPQKETAMPEGTMALPEFFDTVRTLAQVVEVDYFIPGCPPESHQIWNVIDLVVQGGPLPPRGSVIGAGSLTVCDECVRNKEDKKVPASIAPMKLSRKRRSVSWSRGWSAWVSPPGAAAAVSVRRPRCHAPAATAHRKELRTREQRWWRLWGPSWTSAT